VRSESESSENYTRIDGKEENVQPLLPWKRVISMEIQQNRVRIAREFIEKEKMSSLSFPGKRPFQWKSSRIE
jgi:hypothetical protein